MTSVQLGLLKNKASEKSVLSELVNIRSLNIDSTIRKEERISRFLDSIGNPYVFKADDMTVRVRFDEGRPPLQEALKRAILSMCDCER